MITCTFENGKAASLRHVVVHAIVEKDGKLLLVKRSEKISEGGKWALPGGFVDRDETAGEAAVRELREESGWEGEVTALFRVNTNPNRPHEDRQNIAFDFLITPTRKAGDMDKETTHVEWVSIDSLPPLDSFAFDHGESIGYYLRYRTKKFATPVLDHYEVR